MRIDGDILTAIPDPQTVREQLARTVREADILRRLLRLSAAARELREFHLLPVPQQEGRRDA